MFETLRNRLSHLRAPSANSTDPASPQGPDERDAPLGREHIERLRALHLELIDGFDAVLACERARDYSTCLTRLREFDYRLQDYLVNDDAQFHAAMSVRLEGDAARLLLLRSLRARLRQLRRQVHELAYAHMQDDPGRSTRPGFGIAFQSMRTTLRACLQSEDTRLFSLCVQHAAPHARTGSNAEPDDNPWERRSRA